MGEGCPDAAPPVSPPQGAVTFTAHRKAPRPPRPLRPVRCGAVCVRQGNRGGAHRRTGNTVLRPTGTLGKIKSSKKKHTSRAGDPINCIELDYKYLVYPIFPPILTPTTAIHCQQQCTNFGITTQHPEIRRPGSVAPSPPPQSGHMYYIKYTCMHTHIYIHYYILYIIYYYTYYIYFLFVYYTS